jgi:hypothetical protein
MNEYEEYAKKLRQERGDDESNTAYKRQIDRLLWIYAHPGCIQLPDMRYRAIHIDEVPQNAKCEQCGKPMKVKQEWYLR